MHSIEHNYLKNIKLTTKQGATLKVIGEYKGKQGLFTTQTPEILESLRQVSMVESTESSNRIEGVVAPHKRIEAIVLKSSDPKNRSEQEIAGYRDALNLVHQSAEHMEFSVDVILQLHSMMYRHMAEQGGKWKNADNKIVERDAKGNIIKVRFDTVSAVATPQYMEKLTGRYSEALHQEACDPLILIPLTVFDFLCIHPFRDGNGRAGRLLTLMLLYHFGYQVGRYISLERVFEETKETYYEVLEMSSRNWHRKKHDCMPWLNYFWGTLIRAYREFEERVGTITSGRGSKTQLIRQAVDRRVGPFAISDIESQCPGVSRDMVRLVLRQMRDEKKIRSTGKGRGAKWVNASRQ